LDLFIRNIISRHHYLAVSQSNARRNLFVSSPHASSSFTPYSPAQTTRGTAAHADLFTAPRFERYTFVQLCQLLDLSILHPGWLRFPYSVIAAACVYSLAQQPDVACAISGYSAEQLTACVTWLRPFCVVLRDTADAQLAFYDNVIREEQHNIQPHDVTITPMLDAVYTLIKDPHLLDSMCRRSDTAMDCSGLMPTPPQSGERLPPPHYVVLDDES